MKIDGYHIYINYKNVDKIYLKRVKLKKLNDNFLIENVEFCINPEDKILVIEDLETSTSVFRQMKLISPSSTSIVELEPMYNFE